MSFLAVVISDRPYVEKLVKLQLGITVFDWGVIEAYSHGFCSCFH